jgi:flagellar biosynthesis/type III secretory pathway protein FliH
LWLRLLGKGRVQQRAIEELEALPQNNPLRDKAIDLLLSLKTQIEIRQNPDEEDRELLMNLSPIYLERLAEAEQKGRNEGIQQGVQNERRIVIENLLRARFGSLDDELNSIIQPLLALTPEEFSPLLIQLSREEMISRFR